MLIRSAQAVLALWVVTIIIFALSRSTGDPTTLYLDISATQEQRERVREQWGLNKPLVAQYFVFLGNAFQGDLGTSLKFPGQPAARIVVDRLPATFQLAGLSLAIAVLIGVPMGVLSAVKRDSPLDYAGKTVALLGQSMPTFWAGLMGVWLFAVYLEWLPVAGRGGVKHFILPAVTLGWFQVAAIMRLMRSSMLDTLDTEYVKLARIKSLPEWKVIWKHCFRNAALTPLTYFGIIFAVTLTGSVTTETVFNWPGTGLLAFQAVLGRDFALIQALVLVFAGIFILSTLLVDVLYAYLDPRIRYT